MGTPLKKFFSVVISVLLILYSINGYGHGAASRPKTADEDRLIQFPDTEKYQTIVLDPHTHSTFSDGHVWPRIRVAEALRDGLDAMAITEHLEWQPHLVDF